MTSLSAVSLEIPFIPSGRLKREPGLGRPETKLAVAQFFLGLFLTASWRLLGQEIFFICFGIHLIHLLLHSTYNVYPAVYPAVKRS